MIYIIISSTQSNMILVLFFVFSEVDIYIFFESEEFKIF